MTEKQTMEIGFCWPVTGEMSPEEGLRQLKAAGFGGIELWPGTLGRFGAARWAKALEVVEMKCFQLCPYFDFVSGAEKFAESREILERFLDAASQLDCDRLRVFTGPPWGVGVVGARDATDEQWHSAIAGLQMFCDLAPEMEFCLECHEGSLMEDSPSTLRLLHAVGRSNLTTNLQLPLGGEEWSHTLEMLGNFTTHMHIHNWTGGFGRGELTYLCEGLFDWEPVLKTLQERPLCVSVEHADHGGLHDPWETARRDGPFLCKLAGTD